MSIFPGNFCFELNLSCCTAAVWQSAFKELNVLWAFMFSLNFGGGDGGWCCYLFCKRLPCLLLLLSIIHLSNAVAVL